MSTSCEPALEAPAADVHRLTYTEVRLSNVGLPVSRNSSLEPQPGSAEELAKRDMAVRDQARLDGESKARGEYQAQLNQIRANVSAALTDFARERATYYQQVEAEVVTLALSIARKILHREAQLDPLLLATLVHLALQQIESGTKVLLRAHPHQVSEFRSYFAQHMDAQNVPEVEEDPAVSKESCILQTSLGTTQLGIEVQMKEIEQGLFDLLSHRPQGSK
jgi:flagellar assembly protein FliH